MSLWLFVIAIILGFIGHLISSSRIIKTYKLADANKFGEINEDKLIPRLNILLLSIIILGIFSLVIFVSVNIHNMGNKKTTIDSQQSTEAKIISPSKLEQLSAPVQALPNVLRPTNQKPSSSGGDSSNTVIKGKK